MIPTEVFMDILALHRQGHSMRWIAKKLGFEKVVLRNKRLTGYFVKDEDTKNRLWHSLQKVRENMALKQEIKQLKDEIGKKYEFRNVIKGNSPAIRRIFDLIEKATQTNIVVSLLGETGTGKDLLAKVIHSCSRRAGKPLVKVNCAAIPYNLLES